MKKRIILVGNNVNKGELFDVMNLISRDRDIKNLIFRGRFMIFLRFGGLLILLYYSISSLISEDYFGQINQLNLIGSLNLFTQVVIIISIAFLVYGLVTSLNDIKEQSMGIFKYLRYTLSKNVPHSPHDIWRFLQGSVADIQMYNTIRNLSAIDGNGDNLKYDICYTGVPYYDTYCLDSIYIKWNPQKGGISKYFTAEGTYFSYLSFLNKYCQSIIIAMAEKAYFREGNKHVEYSNSVFGMLFSSMYFKSEIERCNKKYEQKIKVNIKIKDDESGIKKKLALEWMKMVLTPDVFEISVDGMDALIEVTDITLMGGSNKKVVEHKASINDIGLRRIPIKRYIAIPRDGEELPKSILRDGSGELEVVCIGGAEQNMALQHAVNCYRWDSIDDEKKIGFAENVWDGVFCSDFLMGTEGLVYGVRDDVMGRVLDDKGISCKAEVYRLNFGKRDSSLSFYGVYGYSAMASKIALCELIYCLDKTDRNGMKLRQFIPNEHMEMKSILDYILTKEENKSIFETKTGKEWDDKDLMNHAKDLLEWLQKDENEIIAL